MNLFEFFPNLIEKKIPLSKLNISPRVFHKWKKEGVIDYDDSVSMDDIGIKGEQKKRKWVILNAFDAIWLLMVKDLRGLNVDIKTLIELKKFLKKGQFDYVGTENVDFDFFLEIGQNILPKEIKDLIDGKLLTKEQVFKMLETQSKEINYFSSNLGLLFFGILILNERPSIVLLKSEEGLNFMILNKEGHIKLFGENDFYNMIMHQFSNYYFTNIPVIDSFIKLFENENLEKYSREYKLFSKEEEQILEIFRNDDFKEITIYRENENNYTITTTQSKELKGEQANELRKILGLKQYQKAEIIYRNDKHLIVNNIKKEKISPD